MKCYYNPVKVFCGNGTVSKLAKLAKKVVSPNGKILIIAWNESVMEIDAFKNLSEDFIVKSLCFNESNPTVEQLFELYKKTADYMPELVIAVGGGSVMDIGKSLCCLYGMDISLPDELREIISEKNYVKPYTKWIGVPTTSGTGSEVTCWATIWDPTKNVKRSVELKKNFAYAAVVDSDLTKGMPLKLAVSSALDAMAHAIESYWANASNIVSKALALSSIRTIVGHIDTLIDGDETAHEYMSQGSMLAGLAFSNTKTTACHSISYPLTMNYGIPHGAAVSMLIAPVMKINFEKIQNADELLDALGAESCEAVETKIKNILKRSEIPFTLEEWKVDYNEIPMLAKQGITKGRADNNPVNLTTEMIEEILYSIFN